MKINNNLQNAIAKQGFPKLRLTAKFAFASLLFFNLDASATVNARKVIFKPTVYTALTPFSKLADQTISGKVLDETGQPLVGVSVKVKGATKGATTNAEGTFTISAPDNAVLIFSYIGYNPQEVSVGGKTKITVNLVPNSKDLHEVVVTALGIVKDARKVGYAVTTVKGEALSTVKETNVALSLEGQVAGLSINGTNGGPGSSARILLRGVTSFGAGSPLFVINGVPMDNTQRGSASEWGGADYGDGISNISPDDIESMTVLKGQSASALYGSRAANGVILITTKGGKKNSGIGVEYSTNYQIDKAVDNTNFQSTYGQGQYGAKPASVADALNSGSLAWGPALDGSSVLQFDGKSYAYSKTDDNYLKFYNTGHTYTNTLSLDGGGETGTFRLSATTLSNASIVPNSGLSRKTFNFSGTQDVTKHLTAAVNINYIDEFAKNKASLSDGPGNPNNVTFLAPNEAQSILNPGVLANGKEQSFTNDIYVTNPYWAANEFITNVGRKRLISSMSLKYQVTDWIYAQARLGYDNSNNTVVHVEPTGTAYLNTNGNMSQSTGSITELNSDVLLGVKHDIVKDYLNFDVSAGGNIRTNTTDQYNISGNNGFIIPYFYSLTNFGSRNSNYTYAQKQTNSAYYTADFNFKDYLTLSTTGRYDVYSTLPAGNNSIFSPSVSGSFIFSNLVKIPALDYGKLRMSYAQTSGEPTNIYGTNIYYNVANSINGVSSGTFSQSLPNLFLKPFTLKEFEVGTELKFLKGRLGFDVDYFARKTKNEIISSSIDISSGYTSQYVPTGSTQNRGVEIEINGTPVRTSDFSWSPSFNFTYVKNKILATDANNSDQTLGTYRPLNANLALVVGMPGPQIMAYDYLRDAKGNIVYAAGIPQRGALKAMGSTVPKIYGGFTNNFTYKKFSLSVLTDYRFGNKILSGTNYYSIYRGENQITLNRPASGTITGAGVNADGTANTTAVKTEDYYQGLARNISSLDVLDGSFIKLRQASFGYTLGKDQLNRTPFSSITFNLVARNIWTIMKHSDNIDPESTFSSDIRYAGIEGTSLPSTRTYGFSLKINLKK
ncbi:SusC/RagA family TonB-linked outer membrane protein [Pedobacter sp. L105]|uniref:SusC/RagA family TonB-linked outer membrane protein n=1 Tax=Pedobacter sp. L105 TaxID=1641871 RepID=UPI00131C6BF8|nr:SusC/RagA family TonB-linked outer membrane protein [Pedobacter sp. L105]